MATQAGIGVLIGLGIGSGITAFLMQRVIRRQDNALQQSLSRLNRLQEDHAQDLNTSLAKMEADYEQQLATKIERYQDTHEEQLTELEAEYEARLAALTSITNQDSDSAPVISTPTEDISSTETASADAVSVDVTGSTFKPIPDPWTDISTSAMDSPAPVTVAATKATPTAPATKSTAPSVTGPASITTGGDLELTQTATDLGRAAATNRKEAIRAIPQLGKLTKDNNADVRLAAVAALQESGSIKAIPFLRQALKDPDNRIVATASAALSRFKGAKKPAQKVKKSTKKKLRR